MLLFVSPTVSLLKLLEALNVKLVTASKEELAEAQPMAKELLLQVMAFESAPFPTRVWKAVSAIQAQPEKAWTVTALAKRSGCSRAAFARYFTSELGISPMQYLTRHRMELAAVLLAGSEAALAEVAEQVGYRSEFAFSRAFKRHHGTSPGAFRRHAARPNARVMLRAA